MASHDRESAEDHHFEPVNYRRDILRAKHANRKVRRRRRNKLQTLMRGPSSYSFDGTKPDQQESSPLPPLDETDDVPDIPIPVAEYPEIDSKVDEISIPMAEMIRRGREEREGEEPSLSQSLSPRGSSMERESRDFDTTPLSPLVLVQSKKSKSTNV